jgi:nitroreductase
VRQRDEEELTMLTVAEAVHQRRSIRSFKRTPVPDEMILEILEAARVAPSGSNSQPWRFVVVTDTEEKKQLRDLCFNQAFVEEAGVDFVICTDLSAYSRDAYKRRRQESVEAGIVPASRLTDETYQKYIESIDDSDLRSQITPATANTYIAAEHIVLMAEALGLGSCWVGGISDHRAVRDLLGIPRGILVLGIIAVGYADAEPQARPRLPLQDILLRPFPAGR